MKRTWHPVPRTLRLMAEFLTDGDFWPGTQDILAYMVAHDGELPPDIPAGEGSVGITTAGALWALWTGKPHPEALKNMGVERVVETFEARLAELFAAGTEAGLGRNPTSTRDTQSPDAVAVEIQAMRADAAGRLMAFGRDAGLDNTKWRTYVLKAVFGLEAGDYTDAPAP